jgi:CDP-diacylglycerol---glycerol-3-phosphate 3-phosphatidyltransferase
MSDVGAEAPQIRGPIDRNSTLTEPLTEAWAAVPNVRVDASPAAVFLPTMTVATTPRAPAPALSIPNVLTYARIAAVPAVVACMYWSEILQGGLALRWVALVIFIAAGVTDFFDGYFARMWGQQTTFGRMLDPIADKLLVSSCLLMLAADDTIKGWSLWAALVILCREILVSGLREYLAGLRVSVPVTRLAKWKTTVQLVAIGFLILGEAGNKLVPITTLTGLTLLWLSAIVTLYTGWDYFRAGVRHLIEERA